MITSIGAGFLSRIFLPIKGIKKLPKVIEKLSKWKKGKRLAEKKNSLES